MAEQQPPAGWHPDPTQPGRQRYWDGTRWTAHVHPPDPPTPFVPKQRNGTAMPALVCGVIGVILGLVPILFVLSFPLGAAAVICGVLGFLAASKDSRVPRKAMSVVGAALGVVALGLAVWGVVVVDEAVDDVDQALEENDEELDAAGEVLEDELGELGQEFRDEQRELDQTPQP